jgi:hypothetical protein
MNIVSLQGNEVICYDFQRTICDVVRTNKSVDVELRNESLRSVFIFANIDYHKLYAYVDQLRCLKKIKIMLEWLS